LRCPTLAIIISRRANGSTEMGDVFDPERASFCSLEFPGQTPQAPATQASLSPVSPRSSDADAYE
jgi:hypothetical protein